MSQTMNMESKISSSAHTLSLNSLLVQAATTPSTVCPISIKESCSDSSREILFRSILKDEPTMIPLNYIQECLTGTAEGDILEAYDSVLDRRFIVVPTSLCHDIATRHLQVQRVYGYSENVVLLEAFAKGTVATFLKNFRSRVQLNAQRRITIMLYAAHVLALGKFTISSRSIGIDNNLNAKVMRFPGGEDEVHNFGILMIELLAGALDKDGSEDRKFGDLTERYTIKGHLLEDDLDPYVRESWTFNILSQLVELSLQCIQFQDKPKPDKLVETLSLISSRMRVVDNYDYY
jgi:hypothetical protein